MSDVSYGFDDGPMYMAIKRSSLSTYDNQCYEIRTFSRSQLEALFEEGGFDDTRWAGDLDEFRRGFPMIVKGDIIMPRPVQVRIVDKWFIPTCGRTEDDD